MLDAARALWDAIMGRGDCKDSGTVLTRASRGAPIQCSLAALEHGLVHSALINLADGRQHVAPRLVPKQRLQQEAVLACNAGR